LRHFFAYHNAQRMGYSSTNLIEPQVKTSKKIDGSEGTTIWLIAGEGQSPKSYFHAAKFIAIKCEPDKFSGTRHPNLISGAGKLFKLSLPISDSELLDQLKTSSANFVNGFTQLRDPATIMALEAMA